MASTYDLIVDRRAKSRGPQATRQGAPRRGPTFDDKLRFLQSPAAHADPKHQLSWIETHMSWLFLSGDHVLKLKKPVRFPFLDFSTLQARELFCREELRLNSRLAPDVYLGLVALKFGDAGFALVAEDQLPAPGETVDWLVRMRRLPAQRMLSQLIADSKVAPQDVDALIAMLGAFYPQAPRTEITPHEYMCRFQRELASNREILLRPQFQLRDAASALDRFETVLMQRGESLQQRAIEGRIVDGHGDLRPEHVCLGEPPVVIDCLEFNPRLRQVDPLDEIAFLALECDMAGAAWIGPHLVTGCAAALGETPPAALMHLYTAHRALLRARLALAHLLDLQPRTPQKWPVLAQRYVDRAVAALDALDEPA